MCKKLFAIAIVGVIAVYALSETRAGSHVKAWVSRVGGKIENSVPPETELARIRHEVGQLNGDIDKVKGDLAEANVNVRLLRKEVDELRGAVKTSEATIRKSAEVLKAAHDGDQIQWGYRQVSFVNAKELLATDVRRHADLKGRLKNREQALATQEQTRDLVEQQLQEMMTQKEELTSAVAEMDAELKLAGVEQIRSKYQNDGTRMSEIKSSLAELRKRVMVQREKLRVTETYQRSPAAEKTVDQILGELDGNTVRSNESQEVKIVTRDK